MGSRSTHTAPPANWIVNPSGEYIAQSCQVARMRPGASIHADAGLPYGSTSATVGAQAVSQRVRLSHSFKRSHLVLSIEYAGLMSRTIRTP
jgi:hypothetical protein